MSVAGDENVFRADALKAFSERHYGRPIAYMPKLWVILAGFVICIVIAGSIFLVTSTYARKEKVIGWLQPDQGLVRISAGQHARIQQILVSENESVTAGQPLIILGLDRELESGEHMSDAMLAEMEIEKQALEQQIELAQNTLSVALDGIETDLIKLAAVRAEVEGQLALQNERTVLAHDILSRYQELAKEEVVSIAEVEFQQEKATSSQQAAGSLKQRLASLDRERTALENRRERLPLETAQRILDLNTRIAGLKQQRAELASRGRVVISAPIDGQIAALSGDTGGTIMPQTVLAAIVPEGSVLYAQIFIPSRAIGFVETGQDVRLMYAAYPHQRFGSAKGTVHNVSRSILRPEEIPTALGLQEPAYKAKVALDQQTVEAFGSAFLLRPGMVLTAEIIQERRTFLQWILEPLRARRGDQ